jgi:hypothetical protein
MMRGGAAVLAVVAVGALSPAAFGQGLAQLPSPTAALDAKLPLGSQSAPVQLPPSAQVVGRQEVLVRVTAGGEVVSVRVLQSLTLAGTGDYFFVVPAPLRDVRAGPGSQAEPGLRRNGILWQGFSNRRRVLVADAELAARAAASALPLELELRAAVDGRPLRGGVRRSGRLTLALRLRNATAVPAQAFSARASRAEVETVLDRVAASAERATQPEDIVLHVAGPVQPRRVLADAPLRVRGEIRLPASSATGLVPRGATVERRAGRLVVRFERLVGGPAPGTANVTLSGDVRDAAAPVATLTADPERLLPELAPAARPQATDERVLLAARSLLRLARVAQYDEFLSNPLPGGRSSTLYRFRTVDVRQPVGAQASPGGGTDVVGWLVAGAALLLGAGLAVLWAHS